jgi:hypothetical protein
MQLSSGSVCQRARTRVVGAMTLALVLGSVTARAHAECVGDCHGGGEVSVDEVIVMVNIALGKEPLASCSVGDENGDGEITVGEVLTSVNNLLSGCPAGATPTPTTTMEHTVAPTSTPTPTPSPTQNGVLSVADAVARDADGAAVRLGQTVTTEGVVTVAAGIFANNKLKVFVQDGDAGIMVYHQSSAAVDAFQPGQRLRATGVIRQQDPTSDANPATGTLLIDVTQGSVSVVSDGNTLPDPRPVTLATLTATGTTYTGSLVRVEGVQKVSGDWPAAGSKTTQVQISDDGGATTNVLRFQRNTITQQLAQKLTAIGNGSFTLVGVVVQDDESADGKLLTDFEIWLRGANDIVGQ